MTGRTLYIFQLKNHGRRYFPRRTKRSRRRKRGDWPPALRSGLRLRRARRAADGRRSRASTFLQEGEARARRSPLPLAGTQAAAGGPTHGHGRRDSCRRSFSATTSFAPSLQKQRPAPPSRSVRLTLIFMLGAVELLGYFCGDASASPCGGGSIGAWVASPRRGFFIFLELGAFGIGF